MNTEYFVGEALTLAASMLPDPDTCLRCNSQFSRFLVMLNRLPNFQIMKFFGT